jgi:hypothetical protein
MQFSNGSSQQAVHVRAPKLLPVSDAHFANFLRTAEDQRHARMLHSILTRPYEKRTGTFGGIENHDFFSRTLAMRKRNARIYREFSRQKENLLLLQRLQTIHFNEHPMYSRSRIGKSYSKEWEKHQQQHEAAKARLSTRPRVGSSVIFANTIAASPLSPRNRQSWEGKRVLPYRDTTLDRDPRDLPSRPPGRKSRPTSSFPSSTRGSTAGQLEGQRMSEERESIEAELQRRWTVLEQQNPQQQSDDDEKQPLDPAFERELGLGPDLEDASIDAWLRAHSNGGFEMPSAGQTGRAPTQLISPRPAEPVMNTARQQSVRARYIDPEEDDVDIGSEYEPVAAAQQSSLYALATDPFLAHDDVVDQYRLHQYSQRLPEDVRHPSNTPSDRPGSSNRRRSAQQQPLPPSSQSSASASSFQPASYPSSAHHEVDSVLDVLADFDDLRTHDVASNRRPMSPQQARRQLAREQRPDERHQAAYWPSHQQQRHSGDAFAASVPARNNRSAGRHSRGNSYSSASSAASVYRPAASVPARRASSARLTRSSVPVHAPSASEREADEYLRQLSDQFPSSSRARAEQQRSNTADKQRAHHPPPKKGFLKPTFNTKHYAAQTQPQKR